MRRWLGFTAALVGLSMLGVVINAVAAFTVSMGRAVCGTSDAGFVCSTAGEQLGIWVPWAGWMTAIVLTLVFGRRAIRADRSPWSSLWIGAGVYAVGFVIAYSIAVS
ncbi:hypothetical protein SAMN05216266_103199 [Amycolatopsis marina]|uniref:Vitamin K epoxide reductase domain-containing protein n=2 Tax=Amycolatopsis marina TaxID=490629 RepID=A0A1I0XGJ0_9PSEU|nr:hypothetical protein SAMN05216266_103199 [Amycolatopsis marina]